MNEPWAGDIFLDPTLLVTGIADKLNLEKTWEYVHKYIRLEDNKHIVMFEGVTWDDIVLGFSRSLGGPEYLNRTVYAYHVYIPPNISPEQAISAHYREILKLGCGWFCSETGGYPPTFDVCDKYLQSWLHWDWKIYGNLTGDYVGMWNSAGTLNSDAVKLVSRTYARAVAGNTIGMVYNSTSNVFGLEYNVSTQCHLPTEIYINEDLNYPKGFSLNILPTNQLTWSNPEKNKIFISKTSNTINGARILVTITPK